MFSLLMDDSSSLEKRIASLVHSHFDRLPNGSKPAVHPNGKREWIPLSGIVLVTGMLLGISGEFCYRALC
jgi:tRNA-specific adenosine deaminase 1